MTEFDTGNDSYELFIDNRSTEDSLNEEEPSSAGNFAYLVQPQLDLSNLLYLKSQDAEVCLSKLQIESLPLTASRLESCKVKLEIMVESNLVNANRNYNQTKVTEMNNEDLTIKLEDHISDSPQDTVDYVNNLFRRNLNHFILLKYLNIFCDIDIMNKEINNFLTPNDCKLLNRYLDVTFYTRNRIHQELCELLRTSDTLDGKYLISSSVDDIDQDQESNILANSACLKKINKRDRLKVTPTVNFTDFYGKSLKDEKDKNALNAKIKSSVLLWIQSMGIRIGTTITRNNDIVDIRDLISSNKALIDVGLRIRSLLSLEMERLNEKPRHSSSLFQKDMLKCNLDLSGTRITFSIFPKQFLYNNSQMTISLPPLLSYALGAELNKEIQIGPIGYDMPFTQKPRLTNNILSPNQTLAHGIRHLPKMIHIVSSVAGSKGRDSWMSQTMFRDYQILFTYLIDDAAIKSRGITSCDDNQSFYRIKQSNRILETMNFAILNENFQRCQFPHKTYTRIALKIRPIC